MDKSFYPKKKLANSVSGNTSSIIVTKVRSLRAKSCAKSRADSWSISGWRRSCQDLKSTTNESKISMTLSAKHTNSKSSRSTSTAKTSSFLAVKSSKKSAYLEKLNSWRTSKKAQYVTGLSKISP